MKILATTKQVFLHAISICCFLLVFTKVQADVRLPAILGSNMVLQQNEAVNIWGWADPGEQIRVSGSWDKKTVKVKTGDDGKWKVSLQTPPAGGPFTLDIKGKNSIVLENVLIGELWVCSGQSNMDRKLGLQPGQKPILNFWETSQKANHPELRLFLVKRALAEEPQDDLEGEWMVCTPENVLEFSAAGYFFGKKLQEELGIPMGLIESAWGGTPVEGWTRKSAMNNDFLVEREASLLENYQVDSASYANSVAAYEKGFISSLPPVPASLNTKNRAPHRIGHLFNAMIHPLLNFKIKGAIWYQGESNRGMPKQYAKQFPNMIRTWREDWNTGEFPFYFVQIAPYYYNEEYAVPPLWEAQYEALKLPHTGMASTHDIGQIYDIHPPEKEEVGRRLALLALKKTYGKATVVDSGPILKSTTYNGNKAMLEFDPMGGTLFSAGTGIGGIPSFYLAGDRGIFHPAQVSQDGNMITLIADGIEKPVAVRYLWNDRANPTIFNSYGLPAVAFRTDDWEDAIMQE